jgi:hypothetical protein
MRFEVYTHFGRVLSRHEVGPDELHHRAAEEARIACANHPAEAWVRLRR